MGQDQNQHGRSDEKNFPPSLFEMLTDKSDPSYDPRIEMPFDWVLYEDVKKRGIRERVTARRNGEKLRLTKGRMRVRCALKAAEEGIEILVPTKLVRYASDADAYEDTIKENELRNDTPQTMRAIQAQKMLDFGRSKEDVAAMFRFDTAAGLELLLSILDLDPKAQKAVDRGEFSYSLAVTELVKFPKDQQVAEMTKLIESGVKGEIAKETLRQKRRPQNGHAKDAEPITKMRTRLAGERVLEKLKAEKTTPTTIKLRALARWFMGQDRAFNQCPDLGKIVKGDG